MVDAGPVRILVVEDDPGVCRLVRRRLERAGYAVLVAYTTRDALERVRADDADLIVLDYRLPGDLNGLEFCVQLQAMGSELPVIMVSGSSKESTVIDAIRVGVRDFLPKSSAYLDLLPKAVAKVLERSRLETQLAQVTSRHWTEGVVLLVEDDAGTAELQRRHLERAGYSVAIARTGADALERMHKGDVALLVLDQCLPGEIRGLEAYAQLQAAGYSVPAILVTGFADEATAIEALRAGVCDLVPKSDDCLPLLMKAVKRAFERTYPESRLAEARARLTGIISSSRDAILTVEAADGHVSLFNGAAEEMFNYPAAEAIGKPIETFIPELFRDDAPEKSGAEARSLTSTLRRFETFGRRRDSDNISSVSNVSIEVSVAETDAMGRHFYTIMARDIAERKRLEAELRQRAEALTEAARQKDQFIAMLAHELRNPLAPIPTAVALLRHLPPADSRITWAYDMIERQVAHMARLVDDLLDVSRLTHGTIALHKAPLDLAIVIQRAVEACRPAVAERGCRFELDLPQGPLPVDGDETRLTQIVSNLLDNAVKYSRQGGRVRIHAGTEAGEVVLVVQDEGRGIDPAFLPHIFEPFSQADHSLDRTEGGLGMGLAFVHRLVEMHGGRVDARSAGLGQGAEFVVRLPMAPAPAPASAEPAPATAAPISPSRRVLVVDDNPDAAQSTAAVLQMAGCEVEVTYDGPSALEAARRFRPQVLLLDLGLPGMDGYTLAQRMHEMPETKRGKFVALSGYGQPEDRRRAHEAGYDHHLVKPVDPAKLIKLVATLPVGA